MMEVNPAPGPAGPAKSRLPDGLPGEFQRKAPRCLTFFRSFPRPFSGRLRPAKAAGRAEKDAQRSQARIVPCGGRGPHGDATCVRLRPMLRLLLIRLKAGAGTRAFALRGADRRKSGMTKRPFPASCGRMRSPALLRGPSPTDAAGKPSGGVGPFPASPQSLRPPDVPRNDALFPPFLPTLQLLQVFVKTFSQSSAAAAP